MQSATSSSLTDKSLRNALRRLRVRTSVERPKTVAADAREMNVPEQEPPSYIEACSQSRLEDSPVHANVRTTTATDPYTGQYPLLTRIVENKVMMESSHLRDYLKLIIAITFSADYEIYDVDDSELDHRAVLQELCTLVRNLKDRLRSRRWSTACQQDKDLLIKCVLWPAHILNLHDEYVLEILGRYQIIRSHGVTKTKTLVDYRTPWNARILPKWTSPMLDLGDTLASHAYLISALKLKKEEALLLEQAMARYRRERGLDDVQNSKGFQKELIRKGQTWCWPLSDEYGNLAEVLRTRAMQKDDLRRWKVRYDLRQHRKLGWYIPFRL